MGVWWFGKYRITFLNAFFVILSLLCFRCEEYEERFSIRPSYIITGMENLENVEEKIPGLCSENEVFCTEENGPSAYILHSDRADWMTSRRKCQMMSGKWPKLADLVIFETTEEMKKVTEAISGYLERIEKEKPAGKIMYWTGAVSKEYDVNFKELNSPNIGWISSSEMLNYLNHSGYQGGLEEFSSVCEINITMANEISTTTTTTKEITTVSLSTSISPTENERTTVEDKTTTTPREEIDTVSLSTTISPTENERTTVEDKTTTTTTKEEIDTVSLSTTISPTENERTTVEDKTTTTTTKEEIDTVSLSTTIGPTENERTTVEDKTATTPREEIDTVSLSTTISPTENERTIVEDKTTTTTTKEEIDTVSLSTSISPTENERTTVEDKTTTTTREEIDTVSLSTSISPTENERTTVEDKTATTPREEIDTVSLSTTISPTENERTIVEDKTTTTTTIKEEIATVSLSTTISPTENERTTMEDKTTTTPREEIDTVSLSTTISPTENERTIVEDKTTTTTIKEEIATVSLISTTSPIGNEKTTMADESTTIAEDASTGHPVTKNWVEIIETEENDPDVIVTMLANKTTSCDLTESDIESVIKSLQKQKIRVETDIHDDKVVGSASDDAVVDSFSDSVVSVVSNLIKDGQSGWLNMTEEHQIKNAKTILEEMENTGWFRACNGSNRYKKEYFEISRDNSAIQVFILGGESNVLELRLRSKAIGWMTLPRELLRHLRGKQCDEIDHLFGIGTTYKGIEKYLPTKTRFINSEVIGVSVQRNKRHYKLPDGLKVKVLLLHQIKSKVLESMCIYWNFTRGNHGEWDSEGCSLLSSNDTHSECECDHLTNFALLTDFSDEPVDDKNAYVMTVLTYICCSLSSTGLAVTILFLASVKSLRSRRTTITCNLSLCLLILNVALLTGQKKGESSLMLCKFISLLQQFCLLAAFLWMLLEGIHLYKMIILVFHTKAIPLWMLYAIAYGISSVIVICTATIEPERIVRNDTCWLSNENGVIWSATAPMGCIILANFAILLMTLKAAASVHKVSVANESELKERREKLLKRLKGTLSLLSLMGITWIVGFVHIPGIIRILKMYLSIILNGLQGVFIFIFQLALNSNVRPILKVIYKEHITRISSINIPWGSSTAANPTTSTDSTSHINHIMHMFPSFTDIRPGVFTQRAISTDTISRCSEENSDCATGFHPFAVNYGNMAFDPHPEDKKE